jgi:hypothetical protein
LTRGTSGLVAIFGEERRGGGLGSDGLCGGGRAGLGSRGGSVARGGGGSTGGGGGTGGRVGSAARSTRARSFIKEGLTEVGTSSCPGASTTALAGSGGTGGVVLGVTRPGSVPAGPRGPLGLAPERRSVIERQYIRPAARPRNRRPAA